MAQVIQPVSHRESHLSIAASKYMKPPEPFDITRQKFNAQKEKLSRSSVMLGDGPTEYYMRNGGPKLPQTESQRILNQNMEQKALANRLRSGARETTHDFGDGLESLPLDCHRSNVQMKPQTGVQYRSQPNLSAWDSQLKLGDGSLGVAAKSILQEGQVGGDNASPQNFHASREAFRVNKLRNGESKVWMGNKNAGPLPAVEAGSVPNLNFVEHDYKRRNLLTPLAGAGSRLLAEKRVSALRDSSVQFGDPRFQSIPEGNRHGSLPAMDNSANKQYQEAKKNLGASQIVFGQERATYSRSNHMPNWHDPKTYHQQNQSPKTSEPKEFFAYGIDFHHH